MLGRITGGLAAALLLCMGAGVSQTQAWNGGEPKSGNTVAINKNKAEAEASHITTVVVTQSPTWEEKMVYEPLRPEEAIQGASAETGGAVKAVVAARPHTNTADHEGLQQAAWWVNDQTAVCMDPLAQSEVRARTVENWLAGVPG